MENMRKQKVNFLTRLEKCDREQFKYHFRGLLENAKNSGDPVFVFKYDKK